MPSKKHFPSSQIAGCMGGKQTGARLQRRGPVQPGRRKKSWTSVAKAWLKLPAAPSKIPSYSTSTDPSLSRPHQSYTAEFLPQSEPCGPHLLTPQSGHHTGTLSPPSSTSLGHRFVGRFWGSSSPHTREGTGCKYPGCGPHPVPH